MKMYTCRRPFEYFEINSKLKETETKPLVISSGPTSVICEFDRSYSVTGKLKRFFLNHLLHQQI